jgi:hypothetical protein
VKYIAKYKIHIKIINQVNCFTKRHICKPSQLNWYEKCRDLIGCGLVDLTGQLGEADDFFLDKQALPCPILFKMRPKVAENIQLQHLSEVCIHPSYLANRHQKPTVTPLIKLLHLPQTSLQYLGIAFWSLPPQLITSFSSTRCPGMFRNEVFIRFLSSMVHGSPVPKKMTNSPSPVSSLFSP